MTLEDEIEKRQDGDAEVDIPEDPGPAVAGKTPLVGSVRRSNGVPVLRDEIKEEL